MFRFDDKALYSALDTSLLKACLTASKSTYFEYIRAEGYNIIITWVWQIEVIF